MSQPSKKYFNAPLSEHQADRKIYGKKVLLVEGPDDIWFFNTLLARLNAPAEDVQIIDYDGTPKLRRTFASLLLDQKVASGHVNAIAVVQDADEDEASARRNVISAFSLEGISEPEFGTFRTDDSRGIAVGAFILPNNSDAGNLDQMLYMTMSESAAHAQTEIFSRALGLEERTDVYKRKTQVYLASQNEICRGAGRGAARGYFDMTHERISGITDFIENFLAL